MTDNDRVIMEGGGSPQARYHDSDCPTCNHEEEGKGICKHFLKGKCYKGVLKNVLSFDCPYRYPEFEFCEDYVEEED